MVPGHELVGVVVEIGSKVTQFKIGDNAGVGVLVDSCLNCSNCLKGDEQYCQNFFTFTYNSLKNKDGHLGGNMNT
jgi:alcohol dehydrogenase (NADP+)